jgi:phasin family protein
VASLETIANAYGAYTGKSVELTWSFLEKLAAVRSLDKAFEVQTEFAKQAFETFLAESRKIHELHSEFARQRAVQFEGFVARITQTTFVPRAAYL